MQDKALGLYIGLTLVFLASPVHADHPSVAFGINGAGPINTISAHTLPSGTFALGLRSEIINNEGFDTQQLERFATDGKEGVHTQDRILQSSISASYGITDQLTLSASLPTVSRKNIREGEIEEGLAEVHLHGDSSGMGDLQVMGQYRFFKNKNTAIALNLGVKAPTGTTHRADKDGIRFETEFQPGKGAWDYLLGFAISRDLGAFSVHSNVLYNFTTEGAQSSEIGDVLSYNVALTYRVPGKAHEHQAQKEVTPHRHQDLNWDLMLEFNSDHRQKDKFAGLSDEHSGGNTVFLSPGIKLSSGRWGGYLSVGLPIIEETNGEQSEISHRLIAGVSHVF